MSKRISAEDLRHGLSIGFQPGIMGSPEVLLSVLANYVSFIQEYGITVQRLENAFAKVKVDERVQAILKAAAR